MGKRFGLLFAIAFAPAAVACVCVRGVTPCTSAAETPIVFVGEVVRDSGEGMGHGPARMVVREVLHGLPRAGVEFEIDTMAQSSCYMRLVKGEHYVIFGSRDEKRTDLIHNHVCAGSFKVRGSELLLSVLRDQGTEGGRHLAGTVYRKREQYGLGDLTGAGVRVVAARKGETREAFTNAQGQFDFAGVAAGAWQVRVESPGMVHESVWPEGPLEVPVKGCAYRALSAADDGRIRGTVRGPEGKPVAGVAVQAFLFGNRGELEGRKLREAISDADGRYELKALPSQDYVVGVNGEKYDDTSSYRPVFYGQSGNRDTATRVHLGEKEQRSGIDLVVGAPREAATLVIEGVEADGTPVTGFGANIEDPAGTQRAFVDPKKESGSVVRVPLWAGETYRIRVSKFEVSAAMRVEEWRGEVGPLLLGEAGGRVRVVLRRVERK